VLEFLDSDLEALIKAKGVVLSPGDVKAYMSMLLAALRDCHAAWVLHRDIKPNNMLISRDGECEERVSTV
jgi:cyclin-dependent kinase 7